MFECVINVSEGRDEATLTHLAEAAGRSLCDVHRDSAHHRSVFTLIDEPEDLRVGVRALIRAGVSSLDLSTHRGVHPRLGAVDVVPFVALAPSRFDEAVALRDETARWAAEELGLPVFLYGPVDGSERTLPFVRRHAFDDLAPDLGPHVADPRRGAVVVGARPLLLAWNLWLRGVDLAKARELAHLVRGPGVRALGLDVGDAVQVSCNLFDLELARPSHVYDLVARHVAPGVIDRAEVVGLAPESLLEHEDPTRWAQLGLSPEATIEARLASR